MTSYFIRVGVIFVQFVAFLAVTGLSAKGFSLVTADSFAPGETPRRPFPVVAVRPPPATQQYQLVRWGRELDEIGRENPKVTFKVPEPGGRFVLPRDGEFEPSVEFSVLESASNGQVIRVVWNTDDYQITGRYFTDGASVRPIDLSIWGASTMLVGLVPGVIAAWLIGRLIRRRWPKHF